MFPIISSNNQMEREKDCTSATTQPLRYQLPLQQGHSYRRSSSCETISFPSNTILDYTVADEEVITALGVEVDANSSTAFHFDHNLRPNAYDKKVRRALGERLVKKTHESCYTPILQMLSLHNTSIPIDRLLTMTLNIRKENKIENRKYNLSTNSNVDRRCFEGMLDHVTSSSEKHQIMTLHLQHFPTFLFDNVVALLDHYDAVIEQANVLRKEAEAEAMRK